MNFISSYTQMSLFCMPFSQSSAQSSCVKCQLDKLRKECFIGQFSFKIMFYWTV